MYYNGFYGQEDIDTDIDTSSQYAVDPSADVQNVDQKIPTATTASDTTTIPETKNYTMWIFVGLGVIGFTAVIIWMFIHGKTIAKTRHSYKRYSLFG